jgi:hypothetical protein
LDRAVLVAHKGERPVWLLLQCTLHREKVPCGVHVLPSQAQNLTLAHAQMDSHEPAGLEAISRCYGEHPLHLNN